MDMEVPHGLSVSWDVVTDGSTSCNRRSIVCDITVAGEANRTIVSVNDVEETNVEILDSLLEPNQTYTVYVRARLIQGTCETREAATVVCRASDDLPPATVTVPVETG